MNYFNYYTEIEETFVRRRGKHLLLSPMDWALIESWKKMGVPLHIALRGIECVFDSVDAKPQRRSVKSLLYCQEEVEAQFAEWLESQCGKSLHSADQSGGDMSAEEEQGAKSKSNGTNRDEGLPFPREAVVAHLAECCRSLAQARERRERASLNDEVCEALMRAEARVKELADDFARAARPNAEQLENSLADLEALLDRAIRNGLAKGQIDAKRATAEEQLRSYKSRMSRAVYEQTLENLLAKLLREECGVPRLSLFYL